MSVMETTELPPDFPESKVRHNFISDKFVVNFLLLVLSTYKKAANPEADGC